MPRGDKGGNTDTQEEEGNKQEEEQTNREEEEQNNREEEEQNNREEEEQNNREEEEQSNKEEEEQGDKDEEEQGDKQEEEQSNQQSEDDKGDTSKDDPFVLFENSNCNGSEGDLLRDYEGDKEGDLVSQCKDKCLEYGNDCGGFIFVKSGEYGVKCYLRKGKLLPPEPASQNDERDCYSVYTGDAADKIIAQMALGDNSAAFGVPLNEMTFGNIEHVNNKAVATTGNEAVQMVDIIVIFMFFIIGALCLGIGVFIGNKMKSGNEMYVDRKEKYIDDV